mmetsp:Transcript_11885/g.32463  ORF Transcript_11885/g.32463 Transcript_11885/m.32463 type:complete len:82 (-) Transcript_11885:1131-1376(-)
MQNENKHCTFCTPPYSLTPYPGAMPQMHAVLPQPPQQLPPLQSLLLLPLLLSSAATLPKRLFAFTQVSKGSYPDPPGLQLP